MNELKFDKILYKYDENILHLYFFNNESKVVLSYDGAVFRFIDYELIEDGVTEFKLVHFPEDKHLSIIAIKENIDFEIYILLNNNALFKIHFIPEDNSVVQTISIFSKDHEAYGHMFDDFLNCSESVSFHNQADI